MNKSKFGILVIIAIITALVFFACGDSIDGDSEVYAGYGPEVGGVRYKVGDEGPGGGIIFYVRREGNPFTLYMDAADTIGKPAHYLEAAPGGWYTSTAPDDPLLAWAPSSDSDAYETVSSTSFEIGTGRKNTALILAAGGGDESVTAPAANVCVTYSTTGAAAGEWFLPSRDELARLYDFHFYIKQNAANYPGLTTGFSDNRYWSSSQDVNSSNHVWGQRFSDGFQGGGINKSNTDVDVRAVRAF